MSPLNKDSSTISTSDRAAMSANKKLLIYSGHDSTLVPLLCTLGVYDGEQMHNHARHSTCYSYKNDYLLITD
jgi:hypothetical protein